MATLLDTSALIVLVRRNAPAEAEQVRHACKSEIEGGHGVVSAITPAEVLVGVGPDRGSADLEALLDRLPVVAADREIAGMAGRMGAYARRGGATIPLPDLLIAATAIWLGIPLLTCDSDFARGLKLGTDATDPTSETGARLWARLTLHPASSNRSAS